MHDVIGRQGIKQYQKVSTSEYMRKYSIREKWSDTKIHYTKREGNTVSINGRGILNMSIIILITTLNVSILQSLTFCTLKVAERSMPTYAIVL